MCLNINMCKYLVPDMSDFQPPEVVDRGPQPQLVENSNIST